MTSSSGSASVTEPGTDEVWVTIVCSGPWGKSNEALRYAASFIAEMKDFAQNIRGNTSPPVTGIDGRLRVVMGIAAALIEYGMRFEIERGPKRLIFDSDLRGLMVKGREYIAGRDGVLIYDQTRDLQADEVELQMSTNTSTLIPALRTLGIPYHPYFDEGEVVGSQNDITFYWKPSKLAAFYNRFSTDELDYAAREPVIRQAVEFLTSKDQTLPLPEEVLSRMLEPSRLLGFYQGFPIFDGSKGFAKLQSRLGIHLDSEAVMISTPLDKYKGDVYELAEGLARETGLDYSKKKNRVIFPKDERLLQLLSIKE